MYFRDIIGQASAKEELMVSARRGIIPHGRLFVGEDGSGALGLAYAYARYINCLSPTQTDSCGLCASCRRFDAYSSSSLLFLFPILNRNSQNLCNDELPLWRKYLSMGAYTTYEEWGQLQGSEGKQLGIFAREGEELLRQMSYQTIELPFRTLIVWLPERMHEALANKLLKLTEEPPEQTVILMVSQNPSDMLGTLRSRLQTIHLKPLGAEDLRSALLRTQPSSAEVDMDLVIHLSGGNYRRALDLYTGDDPSASVQTKTLGEILRATVNARPSEMLQLAERLASLTREEQQSLLSYLGGMLREMYLFSLDMPSIIYCNPKEQAIVSYVKGCVNKTNVQELTAEIDLALLHIQRNVNSKMVFFDLILRMTALLTPSYRQKNLR